MLTLKWQVLIYSLELKYIFILLLNKNMDVHARSNKNYGRTKVLWLPNKKMNHVNSICMSQSNPTQSNSKNFGWAGLVFFFHLSKMDKDFKF